MRVLLPCCVGGESGAAQMARAHHEPVAWGETPHHVWVSLGARVSRAWLAGLGNGVELFKIWLLSNWNCLGHKLSFLLFFTPR